MSEEEMDTISSRGFRHTKPISGVPGYGGTIKVYESSGAASPRVWIQTENVGEHATIHLEVDDALLLAENIIRTCRLHYQGLASG